MERIEQGEIWWADLAPPIGSGPGYRRPAIIVQGEELNRTNLATVVCVLTTTNLRWQIGHGNVLLEASATGLPRDSVANVSQIVTVDRGVLGDRIGKLRPADLQRILAGIDVVLGR